MTRPFVHAVRDRVRITIGGTTYDVDPVLAMAIAMDMHLAARSAAATATTTERVCRDLSAALSKEGL